MKRAKDRRVSREIARQLELVTPPCCPDKVARDARYLAAQRRHEYLQKVSPEHDRSDSVCCCWDCEFFA